MAALWGLRTEQPNVSNEYSCTGFIPFLFAPFFVGMPLIILERSSEQDDFPDA
jgi:hypothetical protein